MAAEGINPFDSFPEPWEIHCDADDRDSVRLERIGACAAITTRSGKKAGPQINVTRRGVEVMMIWLAEFLVESGRSEEEVMEDYKARLGAQGEQK